VIEFNVAQLLKSPVGTVRDYDVDETLPTIEEYETTEPVRGHVKLTRTNQGVLVEARLATTVRLECSRCLEEVVAPLRVYVHEEFLPTVDVVTGLPLELPPESEAFAIDEHHILDLGEAVRQYALLEIPLQPLCRAECAGLCPNCGQNLNTGRCDCPAEPVGSQMAMLGQLLRQYEPRDGDRDKE
jgi:uncharacterized protein